MPKSTTATVATHPPAHPPNVSAPARQPWRGRLGVPTRSSQVACSDPADPCTPPWSSLSGKHTSLHAARCQWRTDRIGPARSSNTSGSLVCNRRRRGHGTVKTEGEGPTPFSPTHTPARLHPHLASLRIVSVTSGGGIFLYTRKGQYARDNTQGTIRKGQYASRLM